MTGSTKTDKADTDLQMAVPSLSAIDPAAAAAQTGKRKPETVKWAALITLLFTLCEAVALSNHEMWRDELQAWMIARDSGTVGQLIANASFEGHPILWHACLWLVARFTHDPSAMQVLHLSIAAASIFLVAKFAPFSRFQKVLFAFGYFPFYEYATISRGYALGNLALFGFCSACTVLPRNYILQFLLLGLLANTSAYGFIIAAVIGLGIIAEHLFADQGTAAAVAGTAFSRLRGTVSKLWVGVGCLVVSLIISLIQIVGARFGHHMHVRASGVQVFHSAHASVADWVPRFCTWVAPVWSGYLPFPDRVKCYWDTSVFNGAFFQLRPLWACASIALVLLFAISLMRKKSSLVAYLLGTAAILSLGAGLMRFEGMLFVLLIASFWLCETDDWQASQRADWTARAITIATKLSNRLLTAILIVHCAVGLFFFGADVTQPFSESRAAADWVRAHNTENLPILGTPDWIVSECSAWLDKPVFLCERMRYGTFLSWDDQVVYPSNDAELYQRVERAMDSLKIRRCLFIKRASKQFYCRSIKSTKLASFSNSMVREEQFSIYLLELD